jgi:hypothetical protein
MVVRTVALKGNGGGKKGLKREGSAYVRGEGAEGEPSHEKSGGRGTLKAPDVV